MATTFSCICGNLEFKKESRGKSENRVSAKITKLKSAPGFECDSISIALTDHELFFEHHAKVIRKRDRNRQRFQ